MRQKLLFYRNLDDIFHKNNIKHGEGNFLMDNMFLFFSWLAPTVLGWLLKTHRRNQIVHQLMCAKYWHNFQKAHI